MRLKQRSLFGHNDLSVQLDGSALAVTTPYDFAFVDSLKRMIPATERKWEPKRRAWLVDPAHGPIVQSLIEQHFGEHVDLPVAKAHSPAQITMRLLDVRYIGAAKSRDDGSETASGWLEGGWNVIFPKNVLMDYFGQTNRPGAAQTFYGVLGVSQSVDTDALKKAWRRLVLQWHPDRAKEPGAREQFEAIQEAYEILSDGNKRVKYDAGLSLQALYEKEQVHRQDIANTFASVAKGWYCPMRCGLILANGYDKLGRFLVSEILEWADIVDGSGRVLVTTWAAGDEHFTEAWVEQ